MTRRRIAHFSRPIRYIQNDVDPIGHAMPPLALGPETNIPKSPVLHEVFLSGAILEHLLLMGEMFPLSIS